MAEKRVTTKTTAAPPARSKKSKPAARKKTDVVERIKIDSDSDDSLAVLRLFMKVYENL